MAFFSTFNIDMKQDPRKFSQHLNEIQRTAKLFSCLTFVVYSIMHDLTGLINAVDIAAGARIHKLYILLDLSYSPLSSSINCILSYHRLSVG